MTGSYCMPSHFSFACFWQQMAWTSFLRNIESIFIMFAFLLNWCIPLPSKHNFNLGGSKASSFSLPCKQHFRFWGFKSIIINEIVHSEIKFRRHFLFKSMLFKREGETISDMDSWASKSTGYTAYWCAQPYLIAMLNRLEWTRLPTSISTSFNQSEVRIWLFNWVSVQFQLVWACSCRAF